METSLVNIVLNYNTLNPNVKATAYRITFNTLQSISKELGGAGYIPHLLDDLPHDATVKEKENRLIARMLSGKPKGIHYSTHMKNIFKMATLLKNERINQ